MSEAVKRVKLPKPVRSSRQRHDLVHVVGVNILVRIIRLNNKGEI